MKDLEKIKSEDLAAQVQDANPANFAIEQEVAQLVGATVPQPTEPSADDARELGAQLLVFLRRALLPIRSALRTAVAAIYAHLDSRCTDYTPAAYASYMPLPSYDPMGSTPRTLPNLLQALTAFAPRKISNGSAPSDGIPDGTSLAHIVAGTDALSVTKIEDDNHGWEFRSNSIFSIYANCDDFTLNCKDIVIAEAQYGSNYGQGFLKGNTKVKRLNLPEFDGLKGRNGGTAYYCYIAANCSAIEEVLMPNMWRWTGENSATNTNNISQDPNLWRVVMGNITTDAGSVYYFYQCPKLIDLEFKGVQVSINLSQWNPSYVLSDNPTGNDLVTDEGISTNLDQFLQNFKEHIALRLTANGSGKTLTLSQAVFSAVIEGSSPICDDIKGIIEDKGWKVQDTNNNIFPTT